MKMTKIALFNQLLKALLVVSGLQGSTALGQTITYFQTGEEFSGMLSTWKSVKDFGAKGDGSTDDYQSITTAIMALKNNGANTWSVLYFPAGTYMISQTVYYTDRTSQDYQGIRIVGEDPATTLIKCTAGFSTSTTGDGQGAMLRLDGTYGDISRISLDGQNRAPIGLLRDGIYGTDWRITDMFFSNMISGIQYGGLSPGQYEHMGEDLTAIERCRFINCTTGLKITNQNCMGIYTWYCLFQDCGTAIDNGGGFAMPMCNVFLRSTVQDIYNGQNGYPILNNTSVGSKKFIGDISNWTIVMANGNKIYNATDAVAMKGVDVMLNNTILSTTSGAVLQTTRPNTLCVGNTFNSTNPIQNSSGGRLFIADQKIVAASTIAVPQTISLPAPPTNRNRHVLVVTKNTGNDASEIQKKVLAACSTTVYGVNPIVHIPKGTYSLKSTVVIPRNIPLQIIGDGSGPTGGTFIAWSGTGAGPAFKFLGPNRATMTDVYFTLVGSGIDAVTVENADQIGGRIYCDQVEVMGNDNTRLASCDWLIDGVENSDITVINQYIGLSDKSVEVRGGRVLRGGGTTPGQVSFINGYSWGNGPMSLDVKYGGRLLFCAYRNEVSQGFGTLTSASSGTITYACNNEGVGLANHPTFTLTDFNGLLTSTANASWLWEQRTASNIAISGNGSKTKVLSTCNMLPGGTDTTASQVPVWGDITSPAANAGSFLNDILYDNYDRRRAPNVFNKVSGGTIDTQLVLKGLEQLRDLRLEPPTTRRDSVTDVKFIRIRGGLSAGKNGFTFKADTSAFINVRPNNYNGVARIQHGTLSHTVIPMGSPISIPHNAQAISLYNLQGKQLYKKDLTGHDLNKTMRQIQAIGRQGVVVVRMTLE